MALTSTHDGQGNVIIYGGTATHDGAGNVVLTVAAEEADRRVLAMSQVSLAYVGTEEMKTQISQNAEAIESKASKGELETAVKQTAEGLEVKISDASKTATDYVGVDGTGVVVGDLSEEGVLGKNVLIDEDSVDIRDGAAMLASFAAALVKLGMGDGTTTARIDLCNAAAEIFATVIDENRKRLNIKAGDSMDMFAEASVQMSSSMSTDGTDSEWGESFVEASGGSGLTQSASPTVKLSTKYYNADEENYTGVEGSLFIYNKGNPYIQMAAAEHLLTMYANRTETNKYLLSTDKDLAFRHTHGTSGNTVSFGVGESGTNRGVYDNVRGGWIVHANANNEIWAHGNVPIGHSMSANCTLKSGFSLYTTGNPVVAQKYGKVVTVSGVVTNNAAATYGTDPVTIFTVPSGYRPPEAVYAVCQGSGYNKWVLTINSSGEAKIQRYGTASAAVQCAKGSWLPFTITYVID